MTTTTTITVFGPLLAFVAPFIVIIFTNSSSIDFDTKACYLFTIIDFVSITVSQHTITVTVVVDHSVHVTVVVTSIVIADLGRLVFS